MLDYPEFKNPQQRPRYTGLPTFMRTPYREDMEGLDIALVGIPFDGGVTNRTGARHGPREIRNQSSLMRMINQATGINPYELCSIADVGDAWVQKPFELTGALQEIEDFFQLVHQSGTVPVSAGGDHSVTLPIFRAIAKIVLWDWFILMPTVILETIIWVQNSIMELHFAGPSKKDFLIRKERSRLEYEDR